MARFLVSLLITQRHSSTKMYVWSVHSRRRYVTMANMIYGLVPLNSHNFVVYGRKQKVWVLIRTSGTLCDQN